MLIHTRRHDIIHLYVLALSRSKQERPIAQCFPDNYKSLDRFTEVEILEEIIKLIIELYNNYHIEIAQCNYLSENKNFLDIKIKNQEQSRSKKAFQFLIDQKQHYTDEWIKSAHSSLLSYLISQYHQGNPLYSNINLYNTANMSTPVFWNTVDSADPNNDLINKARLHLLTLYFADRNPSNANFSFYITNETDSIAVAIINQKAYILGDQGLSKILNDIFQFFFAHKQEFNLTDVFSVKNSLENI